ncbi:hypothetical protein [Enterobacter cloacae complex sp. 418I7]|uniref:hypothetical protein n=1 Tax=Enterobacter cloacae complex sp. 418I7 TaxID=3395839 RepID=UPI003CF54750
METATINKQSEYRNEIGILRKRKIELLTKACSAKGSDYIHLIQEIKNIEASAKALNKALSDLMM